MAKPRAAKKKAKKKDPKKPPKSRKDWEYNHTLISSAYAQWLLTHFTRPTVKALSEKTGINIHTLRDHLDHMDTLSLIKKTKGLSIITENVLMGLAKAAMAGGAKEVKLWLQVVEGWVEKKDIDLKSDGEPIKPIELIVNNKATKKAFEDALKQR